MYDVTKMISSLKGKRGDHRIFRLAENLCMNLLLTMREFFFVKREGKVGILHLILDVKFLHFHFWLNFCLIKVKT